MIVIVAALLSWFLVGAFLSVAKRRGWGQTVRREGPETHFVKDGTPTMGGVPFSAAIFIVWILFIGLTGAGDSKGWAAVGMAFGMYLIGLADDVLVVRSRLKGEPRGGLKAREKFPMQLVVAGAFAWIVAPQVPVFNVFWFDVIFLTLVPIAAANAINFTDGLDGLCAGVVAILMVPLADRKSVV